MSEHGHVSRKRPTLRPGPPERRQQEREASVQNATCLCRTFLLLIVSILSRSSHLLPNHSFHHLTRQN